jgi:hypothetical protein
MSSVARISASYARRNIDSSVCSHVRTRALRKIYCSTRGANARRSVNGSSSIVKMLGVGRWSARPPRLFENAHRGVGLGAIVTSIPASLALAGRSLGFAGRPLQGVYPRTIGSGLTLPRADCDLSRLRSRLHHGDARDVRRRSVYRRYSARGDHPAGRCSSSATVTRPARALPALRGGQSSRTAWVVPTLRESLQHLRQA